MKSIAATWLLAVLVSVAVTMPASADETLVLVLSEHGRTPKLNNAKGVGRDHWSQAYSAVLAGGGIARGKVVGKTDKIAGSVVERPISPKDVLARRVMVTRLRVGDLVAFGLAGAYAWNISHHGFLMHPPPAFIYL